MKNLRDFMNEQLASYHTVRWYSEKEFILHIDNYVSVNTNARWLELGCGSYLKGKRESDEDWFEPLDVHNKANVYHWNATGVDLVPIGKEPNKWRFIQGDIMNQATWEEIGDGYDCISGQMVFTIGNTRRISPGFRPGDQKFYTPKNQQSGPNPLDDPSYFKALDIILTRAHQALIEGGLMIIDTDIVLSKCDSRYYKELGFSEDWQSRPAYAASKQWTVPWISPS